MAKVSGKQKDSTAAELFRAVFDACDSAALVCGSDFEILYCNDALRNLFGYTEGDLAGKPLNILIPVTGYRGLENYRTEFESGTEMAHSVICRHADGRNFENQLKGRLLQIGEDQEKVYYFTFPDDQSLKVQNQRFNNVIDGIKAGTFEWNIQSGEVVVNVLYCSMLGYSLEDLTPMTTQSWSDRLHPDDRNTVLTLLENHINDSRVRYSPVFRLKHREGHWVWIQAEGSVVEWDDSGQALKMFGIHLDISLEKAREEELQRRERNFGQLFNSIDDLLFIMDEDLRIIRINTAVSAKLGYSEVDLAGRNFLTLYPEAEHRVVEVGIKRSLEDPERILTIPMAGRDGEPVHVETALWESSWRSEKTYFALCKDLSRIRKYLDRFETIFQYSPVAMALAEAREDAAVQANEVMHELLGTEKLGMNARDLMNMVRFRDPGQFHDITGRFARGENIRDDHIEFYTPDGRLISGNLWGTAFREQGSLFYLYTFVDLTEKYAAETALRQREEELEAFFRQSLDGFFFIMFDEAVVWNSNVDKEAVMDYVISHRKITRINDAMLRQYGYNPEKSEFPIPEDLFTFAMQDGMAAWYRLFEDGFLHIEAMEKRHDGSVMAVEGDYICLYDSFARIRGFFGVQRDITEREHARATLLARNTELKEAVVNLEKAQGALVKQERLAAVGQLSAGIAHDFNNILTGIIGSTELLRMKLGRGHEHLFYVDVINRSGQRAAKLVQQILDFSRRTMIRPEIIELDTLLGEQLTFLQQTIGDDVEIDLNVNRDFRYYIYHDPVQLDQIIINLALNARDAISEKGTVTISLDMADISDGRRIFCEFCNRAVVGKYVILEIRDTGSGISAEAREKIFEPFFTTKEQGKGTGLGLSQVQGIVMQNRGHLTLESEPGRGTVFTLFYPPMRLEQKSEEGELQDIEAKGAGEPVLVVEDDYTVADVHSAYMEMLGFKPTTASTANEALQLFRDMEPRPKLVLCDMMLTDRNGDWVFQEISKIDPDVKFIFITGYTEKVKEFSSQFSGRVVIVQKPITFNALIKSLKEITMP